MPSNPYRVVPGHEPAGPSVYYADDSPTALTKITQVLSGHGWDLWKATSGEAVIALVDKMTPAVIVTDHQMPGVTGLDLCRRYSKRIPVIVVSSVDLGTERDRQMRDEARKLKCVFVSKKNMDRDLPAAVRIAIKKGAGHQQGY